MGKPLKQRVVLDIGGAASPIVLAEKKRNSLNIIADKLEGYNKDVFINNLSTAINEKGAQLVRHELKEGTSLPFKEKCIDEVHCRQVYEGGIIIDPSLVAKESHRVLKQGGTVTVSGRRGDRANVISAFKKQGFKIDVESKKPQTWFENRDSVALMEIAKSRAEHLEKVITDPEIPEHFRNSMKKELDRIKKLTPDLFIIRFKKEE